MLDTCPGGGALPDAPRHRAADDTIGTGHGRTFATGTAERAAIPPEPRRAWMWLLFGAIALVLILTMMSLGLAVLFAFAGAVQNRTPPDAALERGRLAFERQGGLYEAVDAFESAIVRSPDSYEAHVELARACVLVGRNDRAIAVARIAIGLRPRAAEPHVWYSLALLNGKDIDGALRQANEAVALEPWSAAAVAVRARTSAIAGYRRGDADLLDAALVDAKRAVELGTSASRFDQAYAHFANSEADWYRYAAGRKHGRADETLVARCVEAGERAVALQGQIPAFRAAAGFAHLSHALLAERSGDATTAGIRRDAAFRSFEAAIALDAKFDAPHSGMGWVYYTREAYSEAMRCFDEAIRLGASDSDPYDGRGQVHVVRGLEATGEAARQEFLAAIAEFEAGAAIDPQEVGLFMSIAWVQSRYLDDNDKADEACRRALAIDPTYAHAHQGLGFVRYRQGRIEDAVQCFDAALALNEDLPECYRVIALIRRAQGRRAEARAVLRRGIERVSPSNRKALESELARG